MTGRSLSAAIVSSHSSCSGRMVPVVIVGLTVSSRAQNTNMVWNGNSVNNGWGQQPTEVLPIALSFEFAHETKNYLEIFRLSSTGEEVSSNAYYAPDGKFNVNLDQSTDQTLWYGLKFSLINPTSELVAENAMRLSPNPAADGRSFAEVSLKTASPLSIRLLDAQGHLVKTIYQNEQPVLSVREGVDVSSLAAGTYFVECRAGDWVRVEPLVKL